MARRDHYYNKAKQEGYRSRAAYKLIQLDERDAIFSRGDAVVDLGAAPGGWMQVAADAVGADGTVVGIDFQRIRPLEKDATIHAIRGDVTEDETLEEAREHLPEGRADVVLSDMAPEMSGEYDLDQARSVYLADRAFDVARNLLAPDGDFVVKVFQGRDVEDLRARMEETFTYVSATSPDASRDSSAEIYLVAKGYLDPPVDVGERVEVDIVDTGSEGDGIARIEGYTIFVPDTAEGETVTVEITDLKPRFGFASVVN